MNRVAAFPGTFDPITNGHLDIVKRGLKIFDELVVAVAENPQKGTLFNMEERVEMVRESLGDFPSVKVESFGNLLIDYLREKNINVAIRGLRVMSDFEHEFQMALINRKLDSRIETVFMMTSEDSSYISSRFLKEIFRLGGRIDCFVPLPVIKKLKEKMGTGNG